MLDVIFAIKFVHMIAMAVMFGTWLSIALFTLYAYRSGNTSVVALTAVFVVRTELILMIPALAIQPLAGIPLAVAIGARLDEYWLEVSEAVYAGAVAAWIAGFTIELRIRKLTQQAALDGVKLPDAYRGLFRLWSAVTLAGIASMIGIMALMIWQPHWY